MSIIGNGILCGGGSGVGGLPYETGSVSMSGQFFTINHNLNTTKTIVFFELADLSSVPNTEPISGLCGTAIFGTGQTSAGHTIDTHNYTGYCRSSSTGEVKYSIASAVTSGITTSKVVVDTGINSATTRTYNYVVIAMP